MGQTTEANLTQSLTFWVEEILFLPLQQMEQNRTLLGLSKVPGGSRPGRLTQTVHPFSQSSLKTTKHLTFLKTIFDHSVQGD